MCTRQRVDLHMHSTCSDGSDTPQELLQKVMAAGITVFALTDHDIMDGVRILRECVPPGIRYISGIEFSTVSEGGKHHILGYGCDPNHPAMKAAIEYGLILRQGKMSRRIRNLRERHGVYLTRDEMAWLDRQPRAGKPHLARILVDRGMAKDVTEAIHTLIDDGTEETAEDRIPARMAIDAIHAAGGIAVWAHPLGGEGEEHLAPDELKRRLEILLPLGLQGLECYYSRYSRAEEALLLTLADRHDLLVSGGSDYHGSFKTIALGTLCAEPGVVEAEQLTILDELTGRDSR